MAERLRHTADEAEPRKSWHFEVQKRPKSLKFSALCAPKRRFRVTLIFFCLPALSQTHFAHLDTYLTLPDPALLNSGKVVWIPPKVVWYHF